MTSTVADYILSHSINELIGAFGGANNDPKLIQSLHEEMATSGPGAIHLLNDLYDAKLDHI